jgi:hypothetical protein
LNCALKLHHEIASLTFQTFEAFPETIKLLKMTKSATRHKPVPLIDEEASPAQHLVEAALRGDLAALSADVSSGSDLDLNFEWTRYGEPKNTVF